jgi:hypothetical protein
MVHKHLLIPSKNKAIKKVFLTRDKEELKTEQKKVFLI